MIVGEPVQSLNSKFRNELRLNANLVLQVVAACANFLDIGHFDASK